MARGDMRGRATGIGGIFFKAQDPQRLKAWYQEHLGLPARPDGTVAFEWREKRRMEQEGYTVWGPFPHNTHYFDPSEAPFMVNFRVDDLNALLASLRAEGVEVDDRIQEDPEGRFGWAMDPEGNRIELWEPPRPEGAPSRPSRYVGRQVRIPPPAPKGDESSPPVSPPG